ncbi:MAG: M28 family metallopeptidase [Clostridia bacterium]|nr:M28 family metallopeptidase [Clostridia bacterium]
MDSKSKWIILGVYLFLIIAVGLFLNPVFLQDIPALELYKGPLSFNGTKAYESLKILTSQYSSRVAGTEKGRESAKWMKKEFEKLGLKTYTQEFDFSSFMNNQSNNAKERTNPFLASIHEIVQHKVGINVIGVSPGESDQVVVIGAHRDMIESVQGAEDNGSGTVTILELARVLTQVDHYYTYAFVSFDGEEAGLKGSMYFVRNNEMKIKAAVVMDMVGYKDANALSFYQNFTARGSTQLWTLALSKRTLESMGLKEYDFKTEVDEPSPLHTFFRLLAQRSFGIVNTDSGAFIDQNIPSIGLKAIAINPGKRGYETGTIHNPSDTIEQISAESLEISGRFVEKFVKSIHDQGYNGDLKSNMFIPMGSKYFKPSLIWALIASIIAAMAVILGLQLKNVFESRESFIEFFMKEKRWLLMTMLYCLTSAGFWQIFRFEAIRKVPAAILFISYIIAALAGIIVILVFRFKSFKGKSIIYREITAYQRNILNTVYVLAFFLLFFSVGPFTAVVFTLAPILFLGRVSYRNEALRVIWILLFVLWSVIHLGITLLSLQSYIFDLTSIKLYIISFSSVMLWAYSFVYIISTPPMRTKIIQDSEMVGVAD